MVCLLHRDGPQCTGDSFEASRRHVATLQGRSNGVERQILLCWTQQAADKENGQLLSELHGAVAKNLSQALAFSFCLPKSTSLLYSVEPRSVDLAVLLPRQNVFERITKVAFIKVELETKNKPRQYPQQQDDRKRDSSQ